MSLFSLLYVFFIMLLFCLLNNVLYKNDYDEEGNYKYETKVNFDKRIDKLDKKNKNYDLSKESDLYAYVSNNSKIEIAQIQKKYSNNDWRYLKANDYLYDYIYDINYYKHIEKNSFLLENSITKYKFRLEKFQSNDWKYFIKLEKDEISKNINDYDKLIDSTSSADEKIS